jgi:hypothetical protein
MINWCPGGFAALLAFLALLATPAMAEADQHRVEFAFGGGFAVTKPPNPPPDLPVLAAGIVVWVTDGWGASWSGSYGPGEEEGAPSERLPFPQHAGDRLFIAAKGLFFHRATVRYRRRVLPDGSLTFQVGGGFLLNAGYDRATLFAETVSLVVPRRFHDKWSGLSTELLLSSRLSPRYSFQGGLIIDFALDRWYYQPVILLAVGV